MATNVLIVLDGAYWFGNPAAPTQAPVADKGKDFTYLALVDALNSAGMTLTKAHRGADVSPGVTQNFNFATTTDLNAFDAIWLIGFKGRNQSPEPLPVPLTNDELNAIGNYMDGGGGVFATGDHDSIGSEMCGRIPRVRVIRAWYGASDSNSPFHPVPADMTNHPPLSAARADTTRPNPSGVYTENPPPFVWFENQSDSVPQPIEIEDTPAAKAIFTRDGTDILVYPDHMHEGKTLGVVGSFNYETTNSPFGNTAQREFPELAGHRELPKIAATGTVTAKAIFAAVGGGTDNVIAATKDNNTLSTYDGRIAGVGRIVTGATFHHYVDINLTGDSDIVAGPLANKVGSDAIKGQGFNANMAVFDDIKAVFVNITNWIARPRPAVTLYLERSTFGVDEVTGQPLFTGVVRVTVDGVKPSQFPSGPVTTGPFDPAWAPVISNSEPGLISIMPTGVFSDDPGIPERLQRFTFIYDVQFANASFGTQTVTVDASLTTSAAPAMLTDQAFFQLVTTANPYMLDLAGDNDTHWLSSDLKVFRVIAGAPLAAGLPPGATLPAAASRTDAFAMINNLKNSISVVQFEALPSGQGASALSSMPTTTSSGANVYNFAIARVRRNGTMLAANDVRVFFRAFTSQTTAALTYNGPGLGGYTTNDGTAPSTNHIALPGTSGGQWLSFPFFSEGRNANSDNQDDDQNVKTVANNESEKFFGVLLDTNLSGGYLPATPGGIGAAQTLPTLLTGEHQCLVAQIEFSGTPILIGANPGTSDKLAQRNIAISEVANPGMTASRAAIHSFEIEATPNAVTDALLPDELLLEWSPNIPDGTVARIHIPSWEAHEVVALADRFYPRHEIAGVDDHTIEIPAGGMRYIPLPRSIHRQTGVLTVELPLGIKRGQRFDVSVRQITNRGRNVRIPQPKVEQIDLAAAKRLLGTQRAAKKGVFDLGDNRTLVTDISLFDAVGDFAFLIEAPDPTELAAAHAEARMWRETLGAFQLGIPVSTKAEMKLYQMRLFSLMSWRLAHMPRNSRWYKTMQHYVGLLSGKVQALGGNPFEVPATPDGAIPQLPWVSGEDGDGHGDGDGDGGSAGSTNPLEDIIRKLAYPWGCLLLILLLLIVIWLALS